MNKFKFLLGLCALAMIGSTIFTGCKGKDGAEGPAGTNGTNGADGLAGVDGIDANSFCRDCHNVANWNAIIAQLESSKHGDKEGNMAEEGGNGSCTPCHSRQGFMETLSTHATTTAAFLGLEF